MPGRARFPRHERLTRRSEFQRVYEEGARWANTAFVCYVVQRAGQGRKMGCAVSRKVGSAVVRNRIKRYVREVYRTHRGQLSNDVHLVIVARVASVGLDYQECAAAIHELFRKGDVLSG